MSGRINITFIIILRSGAWSSAGLSLQRFRTTPRNVKSSWNRKKWKKKERKKERKKAVLQGGEEKRGEERREEKRRGYYVVLSPERMVMSWICNWDGVNKK
jgi:hypothetical protein